MKRILLPILTFAFFFTPAHLFAQFTELKPIQIKIALSGEESPYVITRMTMYYTSGTDFYLNTFARGTATEATCSSAYDSGRVWMELRLDPDDCASGNRPVRGVVYDSLSGYQTIANASVDNPCHAEFSVESDTSREQVYYWILYYPDGSIRYSQINMTLQFQCTHSGGRLP